MTPRQRMMSALRGGVPDMVPVCPDTSNYLPCRFTGKPFWDIYFHRDPPLWDAYWDLADRFGFEAWNTASWGPVFVGGEEKHVRVKTHLTSDSALDAMIEHTVWQTPDGELTGQQLCFRGEPPTPIEKPIKDLARDLPKWLWTMTPPDAIDTRDLNAARSECEKRGQAFGLGIGYPGFQLWFAFVHNAMEVLSYASVDTPELLDLWHERHMELTVRHAELCLREKPDYLFLGGSGSITLASPALARKYALPSLKTVTKMAKDAGVPTLLHSCGKSWDFMRMLHDDTDLSCFNPVELPPHGDADLGRAKGEFGDRLSLMGNLHTTDVMLRGTPQLVRTKSLEAMRDAGKGGGFILSTGDQCPRDTPEENLHAMIATAREYGRYNSDGALPDVDAALSEQPESWS
jgi:uroporphyrinogen decarboxylase